MVAAGGVSEKKISCSLILTALYVHLTESGGL